MREIQFRAKRCDNGDWAYSKTIATNTPLDGGDDRWFIGAGQPADQYINENGNMVAVETTGECLFYAIDPETVGQYTGLTDKNGKRVFEGDIIKWRWWHDVYMGRDIEHLWRVDWDSESGLIAFVDSPTTGANLSIHNHAGDRIMDGKIGRFEVVGNIHDNPELLAED